MPNLAKMMIFLGIIFIVLGILLYCLGKIPGIGKLPGDIVIKRENFTFYFPLTTSLLISLIATFILWLWNRR